MDYLEKIFKDNTEDAISPVIAVMLMLVVTVIIAAVVSSYTGSLAGNEKKSPDIMADVKISNTGNNSSFFEIAFLSVSDPIQTRDLKLFLSWKSHDGKSNSTSITGSDTGANTWYSDHSYKSPLGFGPGLLKWSRAPPFPEEQNFGNYTILAGTRLFATPYTGTDGEGGYGTDFPFQYSTGTGYLSNDIDPMQAVLGSDWWDLRAGDVVQVKILHVPSGRIIFDKEVAVEE